MLTLAARDAVWNVAERRISLPTVLALYAAWRGGVVTKYVTGKYQQATVLTSSSARYIYSNRLSVYKRICLAALLPLWAFDNLGGKLDVTVPRRRGGLLSTARRLYGTLPICLYALLRYRVVTPRRVAW